MAGLQPNQEGHGTNHYEKHVRFHIAASYIVLHAAMHVHAMPVDLVCR